MLATVIDLLPGLPTAVHALGSLHPLLQAAASAARPLPGAAPSLPQVIANLRTWILGILAAIATLFLVIGGVRYLAAGGDPSEVERAKSALKSALIGYALAVLAPVLLTVLQGVLGQK